MKTIIKKSLTIATLLLPLNVYADAWVFNANIQYLYAGVGGKRYAVKLVGLNPNPGSMCPASYDLAIEDSNPKLKEMWSLLIAAYMANKPINVYLSGCGGHLNSPLITDVSLGSIQ